VLQAGIDALDLLIPVTLERVQVSYDFVSLATIAGRHAPFSCERRAMESVVDDEHSELRGAWSFAYACGAIGELLSSVVASLVCEAYASTTGGIRYDPEHGGLPRSELFRQSVDLPHRGTQAKRPVLRPLSFGRGRLAKRPGPCRQHRSIGHEVVLLHQLRGPPYRPTQSAALP
jgi:hypothetical protein